MYFNSYFVVVLLQKCLFLRNLSSYIPIEHVRYALVIIHCYHRQRMTKAHFYCDLVIVFVLVQYDRAVMHSILIMVMVMTTLEIYEN